METMIVASLEMVSPMFIALPASWSQVLVVGAGSIFAQCACSSRIFTCRILGESTKVCPAHTDMVEIKSIGSVGGKTPTEPNGLFIIL